MAPYDIDTSERYQHTHCVEYYKQFQYCNGVGGMVLRLWYLKISGIIPET